MTPFKTYPFKKITPSKRESVMSPDCSYKDLFGYDFYCISKQLVLDKHVVLWSNDNDGNSRTFSVWMCFYADLNRPCMLAAVTGSGLSLYVAIIATSHEKGRNHTQKHVKY